MGCQESKKGAVENNQVVLQATATGEQLVLHGGERVRGTSQEPRRSDFRRHSESNVNVFVANNAGKAAVSKGLGAITYTVSAVIMWRR
jgi:hypothetical protein